MKIVYGWLNVLTLRRITDSTSRKKATEKCSYSIEYILNEWDKQKSWSQRRYGPFTYIN